MLSFFGRNGAFAICVKEYCPITGKWEEKENAYVDYVGLSTGSFLQLNRFYISSWIIWCLENISSLTLLSTTTSLLCLYKLVYIFLYYFKNFIKLTESSVRPEKSITQNLIIFPGFAATSKRSNTVINFPFYVSKKYL